jgi:hypothetical protein
MQNLASAFSTKDSIGSSILSHAGYLHGAGKGKATVGHKSHSEAWVQHSYSVEELYKVLPTYAGLNDVYITQNRFYGSRATDRIAELSALYSDLDYYKIPDLADMHAIGVLDLALDALLRAKIPVPSLALSTGQGLALVWRHEPVPRHVLPKWARCQQVIFKALEPLGADPGAKDAARVMRLVGTYNSKSGKLVESIFENLDEVWGFGELAEEILPVSQQQFEEQHARRRENGEKLFSGAPRRASRGRQDGEGRFYPNHPVREPYGRSTAPHGASRDGEAASRAA